MKHITLITVSLFTVLVVSPIAAQEVKTGTVSGQLMLKGGGPLSGGQVFFFNDSSGPPPSQDRYWRIPDHVVQIDSKGKFSIDLPEGKYYLGAIKRKPGEKIGPPREGDYFFASSDEQGMPRAYRIRAGEKIDLGVIGEAIPFQKRALKPGTEITAIEGTILDAEGKPVEGALVFAYTTPSLVGKPVFASERTGKDGAYLLRVHDGGTYYLRVRSVYGGGAPSPGEMIGSYGEKEPAAAAVKKGQRLSGINIRVIKFPGRGPKQ